MAFPAPVCLLADLLSQVSLFMSLNYFLGLGCQLYLSGETASFSELCQKLLGAESAVREDWV